MDTARVSAPFRPALATRPGGQFAALLRRDAGARVRSLIERMGLQPGGKELRNPRIGRIRMPEKPTLFVCHGDDGGPRFHPCRRVQEALRAAGIEYQKVIAGHGSPIPFLRRGSRDQLVAATGTKKLPTLKLPDGTIISHSRAILAWVCEQPERIRIPPSAPNDIRGCADRRFGKTPARS